MNNLYLAIPIRLNFHVKADVHTHDIYTRFINHSILMAGSVKSVIGDREAAIIQQLKLNVIEYVVSLWPVKNGKMKLSDFSFTYSCDNADATGSVWSDGSIISMQL